MNNSHNKLKVDISPHAIVTIVDDRPANLDLLTDVLISEGYHVNAFLDGGMALNAIANGPPDLIILDINMPGMDGFQVCEQLKKSESLNNIPVIFISALTDIKEKLRAFTSGGVDYITKPFDVEEIKARIHTHLRLVKIDKLEKEIHDRKLVESQYFEQLESIKNAIVHINQSDVIVYCNGATNQLFGYKKDELRGKPIETLIPEGFRVSHANFIENHYVLPHAPNTRGTTYFLGLHKNGSNIPVDITQSSLYTKDAVIVSVEISDLSEQQRMELNLDQQQSIFETVFRNIPDALFITGQDRKIIMASPSASNLFGYSNEYFLGNETSFLCETEENHQTLHQLIFDSNSKNIAVSRRILFSREDGSHFPGEISGSKIISGSKKVIGYLILIRDITEREQHNDETLRLQAQLQQAQKMEALGQVTGGVAHDFNNILASILGYTELAQQKVNANDKESIRYLSEINKGGIRARDLVAKMMTFSRKGKRANKLTLNLKTILNETVSLLRPVLTSSINFDIRTNKPIPMINADPVQIQQIIMNLCINARDAMQGKGCIVISIEPAMAANNTCDACHNEFTGDYVRLTIQDSGTGIPHEFFNRLFEPFFTTKEIGKGTGMGLAMVHGITHDHQGHITIKSEKDIGTEFCFYFPAIPKNISIESPDDPSQLDANYGKNKKIVVIDDEIMITTYLKELLESYKFEVVVFNNPLKAIDYLKNSIDGVNLVIVDQTMPEITGFDIAKFVLKRRAEVAFILCTGHGDIDDKNTALSLGIDSFLAKPVKSGLLLKTIKELLLKQ